MQQLTWSRLIRYTLLAIGAGALPGWLLGYPRLGASTGLLAFLLWNLHYLIALDRWLASPKLKNMPNTDSYWQPVFNRIYELQRSAKKRKKRLRNIIKRFRRSTEAIPDATVLLNRRDEVEWVNQPAVDDLGLDPRRDTGKRIDQLIRTPRFVELLNASERHTIDIPSPIDPHRTLRVKRVKFGDQESLLIARDISEQLRLDSLRKDFIANASHELKTPLAIIQGYLEAIETRRDELPEDFRQPFEQMYQQAQRMNRLIEDMLALARAEENGSQPSDGELIDIATLLDELIADTLRLDQDAHPISADIDEQLAVTANAGQMRMLFGNLLTNAVRHTPPGTPIHISWYRTDKGARFTIEDQGPGIPANQIPRLTERFYRGEKQPGSKGTGLGLALCKHILEAHGSRLEISSEIGEGSTFGFLLPSSRVVAAGEPIDKESASASS